MPKTLIVDITNNAFPPISIEAGQYVVWRNLDPYAHSVETRANEANYFNAGAMLPGETSSPILFEKPGTFNYICRFHTDMEGTVAVSGRSGGGTGDPGGHPGHGAHDGHGVDGHGGHSLHHYHGFVTGGRSGSKLFMTHTPVLADSRHNYQVILRGSFAKPEHAKIYEELRASDYGDQVVQIFHDHMSMPAIGAGEIKQLPNASVSYWPDGSQTTIGPVQVQVPGLEDVPVNLEEVIHFHQFDTEADYPDALSYILYGDEQDVFVDHYIDRAPGFHSVAKLAAAPVGWKGTGSMRFKVLGRSIRALPPRLVPRISIVDNAFHLFWLLPPGALVRQAQDPLIMRGAGAGANHVHPIEFEHGEKSEIAISRFVHFDIRLLNYGVLIV
ncbi:cupredoxin domain-containing protein [Methylobacterium planeticum]|uniref:Blue (type 1) copper domain-containing protein n=1 Tax=Methylobacterium planeticum TaxID=2615211 RepID=A0A6N6MHV8_9HYPH|nr:hypothetical protein [Methylobacterium planeticum]KAB1068599.1 hypothetical protein F6X51_26575 [Methylobacterium planeticum]